MCRLLYQVSIKSYCDWTLLFCYHVITKLQPSIPIIDYISTLKPIGLPVVTIITTPSHDTTHDVAVIRLNDATTTNFDCGINSSLYHMLTSNQASTCLPQYKLAEVTTAVHIIWNSRVERGYYTLSTYSV